MYIMIYVSTYTQINTRGFHILQHLDWTVLTFGGRPDCEVSFACIVFGSTGYPM
jgi:hypothetical protein